MSSLIIGGLILALLHLCVYQPMKQRWADAVAGKGRYYDGAIPGVIWRFCVPDGEDGVVQGIFRYHSPKRLSMAVDMTTAGLFLRAYYRVKNGTEKIADVARLGFSEDQSAATFELPEGAEGRIDFVLHNFGCCDAEVVRIRVEAPRP